MENLYPLAIQKLVELAPTYQVACVQTGENTFHVSGLTDSVYNLRSEIDAFLLLLAQAKASNSPQPPESASQPASLPPMPSHYTHPSQDWPSHAHPSSVQSSHTHPPPGFPSHTPPSGHPAPQSSIPLHMQQAPFNASNPSAHQQPMAPHATATPTPVTGSFSTFNPNAPLRPSTFNPTASHAPEPTPQPNPAPPPVTQPTSTLPPSSQPATTIAAHTGELHSTTDSETFATPSSSPTATSQPGDLVPGTTTASSPGPGSPPPQGPGSSSPPPRLGSRVDQEMSNVFTNLNGDALALLQRLPDGDIPGVRYNIKAGSVKIEPQEKGDVDDAISKFQDAYKKVALSRERRL